MERSVQVAETLSSVDLTHHSSLLDQVEFFRAEAYRKLDSAQRSVMGQFLTPPPVAQLMASMFALRPHTLEIIDAGAGVGALSAAIVAAACEWEQKPQSIMLTAYEVEPVFIDYLKMTLSACVTVCGRAGIDCRYEVVPHDFIQEAVGMLLEEGTLFAVGRKRFNCAILNPPYHKISSDSTFRRLLRSVGIETTNLYTAFLWLVAKLLEPNGELVAITPRSFCNGPYFRPFRSALLQLMSIRRIHVFDSRVEAFAGDAILQENVIMHAAKSMDRMTPVTISSSTGPDDEYVKIRQASYDQVVHSTDPDVFIHIVPDELDYQIGQRVQSLDCSLDDLNLDVSTGRVVDFRVPEFLRDLPDDTTVPLIYPANLSEGWVSWPNSRTRKPQALAQKLGVEEIVVPADVYILVKRFTAKEEKRRVVAAIYDPQRVPADQVGFENHLNYFHRHGVGIPLPLAKGLAAYLNSTLVDQYFRQFSGHTQVNATDLRNLKYPNEATLVALGARIGDSFPDQDELDRMVMEELNAMAEDQNSEATDSIQAKRKIQDALAILHALRLPRAQLNDRSALTLLALTGMRADTSWQEASDPELGITEMMDYFKKYFGVTYAPNTRETVRRYTVHQFLQVGLVVANPGDPRRAVTSPHNRYQIEHTALRLVRTYGTDQWETSLRVYLESADKLSRLYAKEREMARIPVILPDGRSLTLTGGGQNELIKRIIEDFCPRFTPGGIVVYVGDAGDKGSIWDSDYLKRLGVELDKHGKMPDVVVHYLKEDWLVLIEAVTSHGPVDIKRHNELKALFSGSRIGLVFVTAFESRKAMVKYLSSIAWETEVWIAESPSHLIHFNGERFLGPYEPPD